MKWLEKETGEQGTIGVGMPGCVSQRTGLVKNANSVWLNQKPFDRDLMEVLGREARFANDANCLAVSEAVAQWPSYKIVKEKVSFPRQALIRGYCALEEGLNAESKDSEDGLRLAWPSLKTWVHVRPSGTEPVVRIIAEAPDERGARELVSLAAELLASIA